jgi:hypothetical protein
MAQAAIGLFLAAWSVVLASALLRPEMIHGDMGMWLAGAGFGRLIILPAVAVVLARRSLSAFARVLIGTAADCTARALILNRFGSRRVVPLEDITGLSIKTRLYAHCIPVHSLICTTQAAAPDASALRLARGRKVICISVSGTVGGLAGVRAFVQHVEAARKGKRVYEQSQGSASTDFDPDAIIARYLANRGTAPTPQLRPTFGKRGI